MESHIKCAGYVRVSTALQAEEGESLNTQRQQITDFVRQKGWELTNIYADEGATGTKIEYRIQFQQMIKDVKQGQFSVIVFTKLSLLQGTRESIRISLMNWNNMESLL